MTENQSTALSTVTNSSTGVMLSSVDYDSVVQNITDEQAAHYAVLTKDIDFSKPQTIMSYGTEVNKLIERQSDEILNKTTANKTTDIVVLTNQLLSEINDMDIKTDQSPAEGFFRKLRGLPIIGRFVKAVSDEKIKHNTLGTNVSEIQKRVSALKLVAMADNTSLEDMAKNTVECVHKTQEEIVALMLVKNKLEQEINEMESAECCNLDELQAKRGTYNVLSKRVTDMSMTEYVLKQNFMQINAIISMNLNIISKSESITYHVIPIWKRQLAMGTIIDNQKLASDVEDKMTQAANNMLAKNAQALQMNSVNIARQSEEAIFALDTLRDSTRTLIDTIKQVRDIHIDGENKRKEVAHELKQLGDELADTLRAS